MTRLTRAGPGLVIWSRTPQAGLWLWTVRRRGFASVTNGVRYVHVEGPSIPFLLTS